MIDTRKIEELVQKLSEAIPPGLKELDAELKKQFRSILESGLSKMDMVSREEFDIQVKVLAKTREKLEQLEQQIKELEDKRSS